MGRCISTSLNALPPPVIGNGSSLKEPVQVEVAAFDRIHAPKNVAGASVLAWHGADRLREGHNVVGLDAIGEAARVLTQLYGRAEPVQRQPFTRIRREQPPCTRRRR